MVDPGGPADARSPLGPYELHPHLDTVVAVICVPRAEIPVSFKKCTAVVLRSLSSVATDLDRLACHLSCNSPCGAGLVTQKHQR